MGTNRRRRHRSWPESLKREIVAASLVPGASVSRVARRYDVNANQVFAWRRRYRDGAAEPAELRLLPVTVTPDHPRGTAPAGASEVIEIVLAGGRPDRHAQRYERAGVAGAASTRPRPARRRFVRFSGRQR